ncbi:hypothetical protein SAMN02745866_02215 [Alteromonadaceae bacterium Bs31]|nr:hypothetical protein SAMN02745866_02215 [Alteromonadaceae bacterium Bs31]
MSDLNLVDFCRDTAKVLVKLYGKFPQKIILYVEDIAGPDSPDEFGLHCDRFIAGFHCLQWLAETDYIQYSQTIRQEAIEDATLTHRSFTFLSGPEHMNLSAPEVCPPAQKQDIASPKLQRRIDTLSTALKTASSDHLTQLVLSYMEQTRQFR